MVIFANMFLLRTEDGNGDTNVFEVLPEYSSTTKYKYRGFNKSTNEVDTKSAVEETL